MSVSRNVRESPDTVKPPSGILFASWSEHSQI